MAVPHAWLLLCALPAAAQMDAVPAPVAVPSFGIAAPLGNRLDFDPGWALSPGLGSASYLKPRPREAFLRGLEAVARANPKDLAVRAELQRQVVADELERIEPRLRGVELTAERRDAVLAQTRFVDVRRAREHGHAYGDGRIEVFVERGWERLPDILGHFRAVFAHEYTHRLQVEGLYGWKGEAPAYATHFLRGLELFGLEALRADVLSFIRTAELERFENGRGWMRGPRAATDSFYFNGFLAGAAYEAAVRTGRWGDAWLYHRLVSGKVDPQAAAEAVLGQETP